jgi:serine/threonine protein phosphatase PrpC
MEDRYNLILDNDNGVIIGGIYDGHNGAEVAENAARMIPKAVAANVRDGLNIGDAFRKAFKEASFEGGHLFIGSTALVFLIKGDTLIVANTGDCRLLLIHDDRGVQLTTDHRVTNLEECNRLKASGATIKKNRVFFGDRGLNISRALGDLALKEIGITEEPDVGVFKLPPRYTLIAATDGLWAYLKNHQVGQIASADLTAEQICQELIRTVKETSSRYRYLDNTTLIILKKTDDAN